MTAGTPALYLYAITRACETDLAHARAVGTATAARMLEHDGLALVVSEIAPAELEDVSTDDLSEGSRLADLARAHDAVVRATAEQTATLPLRFGTVVADEAAAMQLLAARAPRARELLSLVEGHREWGVRLRERAPEPVPAGAAEPEPAASGTQYLAKRRKARTDAAAYHDRRRACAQHTHEALAAVCRTTAQRSPREQDILFDAAYLVGTGAESEFLAETGRLAKTLAADGMQLETTGPWPPYSFAREGLADE